MIVCQSLRPLDRSKASSDWLPGFSSQVARKMRSPATAGEPLPRPGTSAVQSTFSVADHESGTRWPGGAWPSCVGPRQQGQSAGIGTTGVVSAALRSSDWAPHAGVTHVATNTPANAVLNSLPRITNPPGRLPPLVQRSSW